jgi:hypothetical protein
MQSRVARHLVSYDATKSVVVELTYWLVGKAERHLEASITMPWRPQICGMLSGEVRPQYNGKFCADDDDYEEMNVEEEDSGNHK